MVTRACAFCGKNNLSRDEVGLNKKLIDVKVKRFYCYDCMAEDFDCTIDDLKEKARQFKEEGCKLF